MIAVTPTARLAIPRNAPHAQLSARTSLFGRVAGLSALAVKSAAPLPESGPPSWMPPWMVTLSA
jgi:hypothetical protein